MNIKPRLYYKNYHPRGYWILFGLTKRALRFRKFKQAIEYLRNLYIQDMHRELLNEVIA